MKEFENAVYQGYDFTQLTDFGSTLHNNINEWFSNEENIFIWEDLQSMLDIEKTVIEQNTANLGNPFFRADYCGDR